MIIMAAPIHQAVSQLSIAHTRCGYLFPLKQQVFAPGWVRSWRLARGFRESALRALRKDLTAVGVCEHA